MPLRTLLHTSFTRLLRHRFDAAYMHHVGSLLEPDDVTFSVLIRGYGEAEPPQWLAISGLLSMMSRKYEVQPSTGDHHRSCNASHLQQYAAMCPVYPCSLVVRALSLPGSSAADTLCESQPTESLLCAASFNALLEICARTKDSARGYEVIERMQRAGVLPDDFTLEAVKQRKALRAHLKRVYDL